MMWITWGTKKERRQEQSYPQDILRAATNFGCSYPPENMRQFIDITMEIRIIQCSAGNQ